MKTFGLHYYSIARRLSLFGHIARMPDETDARSIITALPSENWRTTWMKTIQLDEVITVAQNRPLWRLMSAFGATHPLVVHATQEEVKLNVLF